ncbi:MAG: glycosyltransferase family 2 protein [Chloroflexi bacterium]|nr:glycosyltransferase family 2 protein [Chloroflexota bacterium]
MPELSLVIVSWNVRDLLVDCLASVFRSTLDLEVIVVDAASSDGSAEMVSEHFPEVRLIEPGYNTGFTKGNNLGIEQASGRLIGLLNPDTDVIDDALAALVAFLEERPEVGIVGPQLLNDDGSVQSSRRRFPTLLTGLFESTWLEPMAPRSVLRHYRVLDREDDQLQPVDWVTGAALIARRELFEEVGLLDEGFFMYSEELDWQRRVKASGWEIWYEPQAQIVHYGGKSSEQVVAQRDIYFHTSKIRYFSKYHGRLAGQLLRVFLLANYAWQIMIESVKGLLGHRRTLRAERVSAYRQVLRSGLKVTS